MLGDVFEVKVEIAYKQAVWKVFPYCPLSAGVTVFDASLDNDSSSLQLSIIFFMPYAS